MYAWMGYGERRAVRATMVLLWLLYNLAWGLEAAVAVFGGAGLELLDLSSISPLYNRETMEKLLALFVAYVFPCVLQTTALILHQVLFGDKSMLSKQQSLRRRRSVHLPVPV